MSKCGTNIEAANDGRARASGDIHEAGFSLVETVVALAIFALAFSALYRNFDSGWRGVRSADLATEALDVARSQLAAAGIETPLVESRRNGVTAGGVAWEVDIRQYLSVATAETNARAPNAAAIPAAYWVTVRAGRAPDNGAASRSGAPVIELTSIKLGARP